MKNIKICFKTSNYTMPYQWPEPKEIRKRDGEFKCGEKNGKGQQRAEGEGGVKQGGERWFEMAYIYKEILAARVGWPSHLASPWLCHRLIYGTSAHQPILCISFFVRSIKLIYTSSFVAEQMAIENFTINVPPLKACIQRSMNGACMQRYLTL